MKKFCTKCGCKLEKDEICTCEKRKEEQNENRQMNLLDKIVYFLKNPSKALKNIHFLEGNEYMMLLLSSISFGFLGNLTRFGYDHRNIISISLLAFLFFVILSFFLSTIKKQIEYQETIKIVSTSSIILFVGNLIAIIFSILSPIFICFISIFHLLLFSLYCYQALMNYDNGEYTAYEFSFSFMITIMIMFFLILCI